MPAASRIRRSAASRTRRFAPSRLAAHRAFVLTFAIATGTWVALFAVGWAGPGATLAWGGASLPLLVGAGVTQ